jgi:hypothetical protein
MENCALKICLREVGRAFRRSVDWRETGVYPALNITPKTTDWVAASKFAKRMTE